MTTGQKLYAALEIDLDTVPIEQLDDYIAIAYFLTLEDETPDDAKNLEKVDKYLQVFYHLCEVSDWQKAGQVLSFCPMSKELHEQLRIWGCYREQIELYQNLFGKVSSEQDLICLNGLGKVFLNLSDYDQSLDYYQQLLQYSRLTNNRRAEAQALGGLGDIQGTKRNDSGAIALYQQQLEIAREIGDREQEGYALVGLGHTLYFWGLTENKQSYRKKGLNYLEEALEISLQIGNWEMESLCLYKISDIYLNYSQYDQALIYLLKNLHICDKTNDKRGRYLALKNLGECYHMLKQCDHALKYLQETLMVVREVGDKVHEGITLNSIGIVYGYELKQFQVALTYFEQALQILQDLHLEDSTGICTVNVFACHFYLKNQQESAFYLKMAQSIATESKSIEVKGVVTMAIANAYWGRDELWYKAWGLVLAVKSLIMLPPWQSVNGRLALQVAIKYILGWGA